MIKIVKLFGFDLNDTSGVLLFIFAILFLLGGVFMLYSGMQIYNATSQIAPMYVIAGGTITILGIYILVKTIQQRNK